MSVVTIFTKFPSKEIFEIMMKTFEDSEGNYRIDNMDIIGYMYTDPIINDNDEIIKQSEQIDGYHVNFYNSVPDNFHKYIIPRPETPLRIFAGDDLSLEI